MTKHKKSNGRRQAGEPQTDRNKEQPKPASGQERNNPGSGRRQNIANDDEDMDRMDHNTDREKRGGRSNERSGVL